MRMMMIKINGYRWGSVLILCLSMLSIPALSQTKPEDLAPSFRRWLEQEVVYLITPKEKEVFLQLETDRERNQFVEAFWRYRDPNPSTPENEFKIEHYQRISYANQKFGREGPGAGWRSAMGRIYIILGEPPYVERYENLTLVYPMVIWSYSAMPEMGLNQAFNVAFFKPRGIGEYELYSPIRFGPTALLINYNDDQSDTQGAYFALMGIEPAVAAISLSLIPGETNYSLTPSLASEILVNAKIPSAPHYKVEDTWAEKLLEYKDIVEVDYSTNYITSESFLRVIEDKSGIHFVHYLIEPSRLTFEQFGERFLSNLEINGNVSDLEGNTVYQFERSIPIEFNPEQMNSIRNKLFSYQDLFPLVEGDYKLSLLFKNRVSKEFSSMEHNISIHPSPNALQMSPLTLANRAFTTTEYQGKSKPFLIGEIQVVPSPRNDFTKQDVLSVFFQIHGLTADMKKTAALEYTIMTGDETVRSFREDIKVYPQSPNFLKDISLSDLTPAYYKIRISLLDQSQAEVLSENADFYITHAPSLARPWILSFPVSSTEDPAYMNILGNQHLNKKNLDMARKLLEAAFRSNTISVNFALDYCRVLLAQKAYREVKEVAQPFLDREEKHEFYAILGQSCQELGQWAEAIIHYKSYLAYYGTNIQILNSVGDCYLTLGDKEEALNAWERSLELDPNQERIKKLVASLKERNLVLE